MEKRMQIALRYAVFAMSWLKHILKHVKYMKGPPWSMEHLRHS